MTTTPEIGQFREGMARLGAAVTILTTDGPAGRHGMTASAVCSVTDSPPTLLVCVNRASRSHDHFAGNKVLAVNVLAGRHKRLSEVFARTAEEKRFGTGDWSTLVTGSPVLADASVAFDCRVTETSTVGSHSVFFCEVCSMALHGGRAESLIWFGRDFHHIKEV